MTIKPGESTQFQIDNPEIAQAFAEGVAHCEQVPDLKVGPHTYQSCLKIYIRGKLYAAVTVRYDTKPWWQFWKR